MYLLHKWLTRFKRWQKQRFLRHQRISVKLWDKVVEDALKHYQLNHNELLRLRELASLFLHKKAFIGAHNLQLNDYQRTVIAAVACLLILNLDLGYYDGWIEIIVYDEPFIVHRQVMDEAGVIHEQNAVLEGEAWGQGPVILVWKNTLTGKHSSGHGTGSNVILHEFAHKLDMLNGAANGMPPLHANMLRHDWTQVLTRVYEGMERQLAHHKHTRIDPYAVENPAEFFAVISEAFFEIPEKLHHYYPDLYGQLKLFYRQDPYQKQKIKS